MILEDRQQHSLPSPIVIARRWDALGGRLNAILNAWSVARTLGLEFRFVWPRGAFRELAEPRELFDDAFLERFEIAESSCDNRVVLPDPTGLSLPDAKELCRAASANSMIEIDECFNVVAFASEPAEAAQARFRAGLSEIGWSRASRALIKSVSGMTNTRADTRRFTSARATSSAAIGDSSCRSKNTCRRPTWNLPFETLSGP